MRPVSGPLRTGRCTAGTCDPSFAPAHRRAPTNIWRYHVRTGATEASPLFAVSLPGACPDCLAHSLCEGAKISGGTSPVSGIDVVSSAKKDEKGEEHRVRMSYAVSAKWPRPRSRPSRG